ncbi:MAG: hypothetical protein ACI4CZ_10980 [Hominisplanchenecus sp.]
MQNCSNLYLLSTLACKIAECLSAEDVTALSADLMTLGDMLISLQAHQAVCEKNSEDGSF